MSSKLALVAALAVALLPSRLKIWILRKRGARIGPGCWIGMSVIDARELDLGNNVRIGSFNLIHRLAVLRIGHGARMNNFNWITGAGKGDFELGHHSAITRLHFFEASGSICVGDNTIVAGRGSHFFTHGISPTNLDDVRPIVVGDWCYIGSSSRFAPGSAIADCTFVGMGSVVTKAFADRFVLLAGSPAVIRKRLSPHDLYFSRKFLPHAHHPPAYAPDVARLVPLPGSLAAKRLVQRNELHE